MAKLKNNKLLKGLRGKVGNLVFRLIPDGSTVASLAPTRKKKKGTPTQIAYRNGTFKERIQWARWPQHEYPIYAELAMSDIFSPRRSSTASCARIGASWCMPATMSW